MIILHDDGGGDLERVQAMAGIEEGFGRFDYVRITQKNGAQWIGQIVTANRNISTVGARLDPTILHGLQLLQDHDEIRIVDCVHIFEIMLLGERRRGQLLIAHLRPCAGARVEHLEAVETRIFLALPPLERPRGAAAHNVIGVLPNVADAPLSITPFILQHHIMVAGGTGAGKSNVMANLVRLSADYGRFVLLHDPKPDYPRIAEENRDERVRETWPRFEEFGLVPAGAVDVVRVGFHGHCDPSAVDMVLGLGADDLAPEGLASVFFSPSANTAEQNAYESFAAAAHAVRELRASDRRPYALQDILDEVRRRGDPDNPSVDAAAAIHPKTADSIIGKVNRRKKALPWLDAVGRALRTASQGTSPWSGRLDGGQRIVERFDFERVARAGRILVVDYERMDDAEYALILSFFLRAAQRYCRERHAERPPVQQFVDEAHRIFDNDSRHNRTLERSFNRAMREGRSLDHGLVLGLQNASQIPAGIMNLLNSRIVLRQNSKGEADAATQTLDREFSATAMRLGTGQALVSLYESPYVVSADMAPSPYELLRADNKGTARVPLESEREMANGRVPTASL